MITRANYANYYVPFQAFYFPNHTGVPIFSPEDLTPLYVRMEMHYDNPSHIEGSLLFINNIIDLHRFEYPS